MRKNKREIVIILSIVIILMWYLSYIYLNSGKKQSTNSLTSGLAVYIKKGDNYSAVSNIPKGGYTLNTALTHCIGGSEISEYNASAGTINYALNGADWCYIYFDKNSPFVDTIIAMSSNNTEVITNNIAVDAHTDSTDNSTYYEYRYIGANPNNYACFSSNSSTCINSEQLNENDSTGALFRIIGVFDEHTHGQSGEQLVKLITADALGETTIYFDYKQKGVGSTLTLDYGSNDWSDSQLMYMLNGSEGNNKGYQSLTPVYGTTTPIRTLTYSNNNVYYNSTNYFYTNYSGYSYLSGSTSSSRTLNKPSSVSNGSNYSSSTLTVNSLVPSQTSMIEKIVWHLGGYSSTSIKTSAFYTYERGSAVYSTSTTRPYTWIGKIGLMYPSDYGYATSGGTTYNRNTCLTSYNLGSWNNYSDCKKNDWLLYPGARTGTQGTATDQWTISPISSNSYMLFGVYSGYIGNLYPKSSLSVRPAFYLESEVSVAGGDGTSTTPYLLTSDTDGKPEILNIINTGADYKLTAVAIDDKGLSGYALSTSNTVEPTNWTSMSGMAASISAVASSAGEYYLWVKDLSGNVTVTTNSYYLVYDSIKPTISNASITLRTLTATLEDNKTLAGYAFSTSNTTEPTDWTTVSGTSYSLNYTANSNIIYYLWVKDSSGNIFVSTEDYYLTNLTNLVNRMQEIVTLGSATTASDIQGNYTNYRYIGANPNNYACFSSDGSTCINSDQLSGTNATGSLFRIIGSFAEDTHGITGKQLVKLITADSLGSMDWDFKKSGVGSSTNKNGSTDWSDSQLMYTLNGSEGNNKGYQSLTPVYGTTTPIRTLTYSNNNVYYNDTNYFYTNYNGNSYLSAGDGSTSSSRTLNLPVEVAGGKNYSSSTLTVNALIPTQALMIKEVVWHLGGPESSSLGTSSFYSYERGTEVHSGRPTTWIGKIGLMYSTDYAYATAGGTTTARSKCIQTFNLWTDDCSRNDWLLYPGARTGVQGVQKGEWTIVPQSFNDYYVFYASSSGCGQATTNCGEVVRPTFYLEPSVRVSRGSGTSQDPYLLVMPEVMISDISSNLMTISANITTVFEMSSFGLSTSSSIEPTTWLTSDNNGTLSGTTRSLSYTASTAGTYYLWVKDINGNTISSSSPKTLIGGKILNISSNFMTISANITTGLEMSSFGLSTSASVEPTTWLTSDDNGTLFGTTRNFSHTSSSPGTYYLWVKDINGNTIVSSSSKTLIAGTISNVSSNLMTVNSNITTGLEMSSFGLSTSNTIEPTAWLTSDDNGVLSGTTRSLSYTASVSGTYYLWVKDVNGNTIVSNTLADLNWINFASITKKTMTISASIESINNLGGFALSTSNTTVPTTWLTSDNNGTINGTSYSLEYTTDTEGTYYLWVKDSADNTIVSDNSCKFTNADPLYEYITALVSTNSTSTTNKVYQDDFGNTRYAGPSSSVLNYICLDQTTESDGACSTDGLYRIIGVTTTNSSYTSTSTGQNYIKVIKSTSYAYTAWNSSSSNNWSTASLNTTLNGTYLTALNTQLDSKAALIVNATWWLYGQSSTSYTPINMYKVERNLASGAVYSGNPTTSTGKIGLMYPSDYGYASSSCSQNLYNYQNSTCKANNWMTGSSTTDWFITPRSSSGNAYSIYSYSSPYVTTTSVTSSRNVRPVLYLSDDTNYESGDGSASNPYRFN